MISFRLTIHNQDNFGDVDWSYVPAWSYNLPDKPDVYPIRCNVYQCKELPASDNNGTSDPYVKVWSPFEPTSDEVSAMKTRIVHDNNNPIFYSVVQSIFYAVDYEWAPPVVLDIFDQDSGAFDSDDFIGRAVVFLSDAGSAVSREEDLPIPKWFPVKMGFREDEPEMGQILVSFNVLNPKQQFRKSLYDIRLSPHSDDYDIIINVLGLRKLESPGILPVRKPFINFMLRSLLPPNKAAAIENISTQPSATGSNPTISTVVKFTISLPNDPLYCPSLTCGVYDYILKGASQPLIGNFVIPIGDLQTIQTDLFKSEDKTTQEIIRSLAQKIQNAEAEKMELKRQREEGEKEKKREEEMKKVLRMKSFMKERHDMAKETSPQKSLNRSANDKSGRDSLIMDPDGEDIEMGLIKMDNPTDTQHNIEETKEEVNESAMLFLKNRDSRVEEDKHTEKTQAIDLIHKKEEQKELMKKQRTVRLGKMFKQMKLVGQNVVFPTYEMDQRLKIHREGVPPPKEVYMPVGYDPTYDSKQKHFRRYYEDELENIAEVMPKSPFHAYDIMRGQSRGVSKSWIWKQDTDEAGQVSTEKKVGEFKGIVSVVNRDAEKNFAMVKSQRLDILKESLQLLSQALFDEPFDYNYDSIHTAEGKEVFRAKMQQMGCDNLQIDRHFTEMNYKEELARLMMTSTDCLIRVYILGAEELPPKDSGGSVDPYIVLKLNGETISEKENYAPNNHNPGIYKMFEFHSAFPGCNPLKIQMWDHDTIFGDDFIGETYVDLEDRFFSPEWQSIKDKPIEYRQLYHQSTKVSQGIVKMWVDILPEDTVHTSPKWDITPRPPSKFEVRLVVWETKDVKMTDWEGTSDIYCRAYFDSAKKTKRTDTHYRSMDGRGSFNYRILFDIEHPGVDSRLTLQVWDADMFSKNDFIGDTSLNLILPIEDATMADRPIHLNKKYYNSFLRDYMSGAELEYHDDESFWIEMKDKTGAVNGKMRIQLSVYPKDTAEAYAVGEGRTEPNHSPFLPPPVGRIIWTLNPWTMLNQCVAPAVRNKVMCAICLILCVVICFLMLPNIIGNVIAGIII